MTRPMAPIQPTRGLTAFWEADFDEIEDLLDQVGRSGCSRGDSRLHYLLQAHGARQGVTRAVDEVRDRDEVLLHRRRGGGRGRHRGCGCARIYRWPAEQLV